MHIDGSGKAIVHPFKLERREVGVQVEAFCMDDRASIQVL